jgi:hypothetical protein
MRTIRRMAGTGKIRSSARTLATRDCLAFDRLETVFSAADRQPTGARRDIKL